MDSAVYLDVDSELHVQSVVYLDVEVDGGTCGECNVFTCGGWGHMENAVYLDVEIGGATCGECSLLNS